MSLDSVIQKHCDYWKHSNNEAVLQEVPFIKWQTRKSYPVKGRYITEHHRLEPDDIDIDKFLGLKDLLPSPSYGNRINTVMPKYTQSWMSGILGCIIYVSSVRCRAIGANACDIKWLADEFKPEQALRSHWYEMLQNCTDALVTYAGDEAAVSQFHLHGLIDMLAAFFKEEALCAAVYDYPEKIEKLTEKFTELYIAVAKSNVKKRGLWNGGTALNWGIYAPGELLGYQVDASLFSKPMYEKLFLKFDTHIINEFDYSLVHTHYNGLHIIESLCGIEKLKCIQMNLDRETVDDWSLGTVIDACKKVQDAGKCVLINGELSQKEVDMMQNVLKPEGLMIFYWLPQHWESTDIF